MSVNIYPLFGTYKVAEKRRYFAKDWLKSLTNNGNDSDRAVNNDSMDNHPFHFTSSAFPYQANLLPVLINNIQETRMKLFLA